MKRFIGVLVLGMFFAAPSFCDDGNAPSLDKGLDALSQGDYKTAFKIFLPLAEGGDPAAQYCLGSMYTIDGQVEKTKNFTEAAKWYRMAAEQGFYFAQHELGSLYCNGSGVEQNASVALVWYHKAAEQGYTKSETLLGFAYYVGKVCEVKIKRDLAKAGKWFRVVAEKEGEFPYIQYLLGSMYQSGEGVPQNYTEALKWYRKSIEGGDNNAMGKLAVMYYFGQGVIQNYTLAHMWLNLASAHGDERAGKMRDEVATQMAPDQISKAQNLAMDWLEKNRGAK